LRIRIWDLLGVCNFEFWILPEPAHSFHPERGKHNGGELARGFRHLELIV